MKLLIILSIVAYGYTDKLDRTYLPPPNAGSAGGSPGALAAPGVQIGSFGQGLPSSSAPKFGVNGATNFGQGGANGAQNRPGLSQSSGPGSASQGSSSIYQAGPTEFGTNFGQNKPSLGSSGYGQPSNSFGSSNIGNQGTGLSSVIGAPAPSLGPVSALATADGIGTPQTGFNRPSGQAGSGPFNQGFGSERPTVYEAPRPERPQAAAEKNADILKFVNENDGESYNFSYETSNGISAEEAGVATNGVLAQGGFSYTGDDGNKYSITYTADENGFQPQGEHLPTPPPIPDEILKSIEENARAAAAGTQEGAYRPEEYESEGSPQQNNLGASPYNQPQSQNQGYPQLQGSNLIPGSQFSTNQGNSGKSRPNASFGQFGQIKPGQFQPGFGSQNQGAPGQLAGQGSIEQNYQNGQGQTNGRGQGNGYQYNQPQNAVSTTSIIGQNRPQSNDQGSIRYSAGSAQNFGPTKQDSSVYSQRPSGTVEGTQNQLGSSISAQRPTGSFDSSGTSGSFGLTPSYGPSGPAGSVGSNGFTVNNVGSSNGPFKTSGTPGTSRPTGVSGTLGSSESTGSYTPFNQGQLPSPGSKIPSLGANQPSLGTSQNSLQGLQSRPGQTNRPFGSTSPSQEGYQYGLNANQPAFNTGTGIPQGRNEPAAAGSSRPSGSQLSQQPTFGSQGPQSIDRPGQQYGPASVGSSGPIGSQPSQQPGFDNQGPQSIGRPGQQYGPASVGSSGPIGSQASQQPGFGNQGLQSIGRPSQQYGPAAAGSSRPLGSQTSQQPSFGSQRPQSISRPGQQYGPAALGSSGSGGSQLSQQPSFGSQGPQSLGGSGQQYGAVATGSYGASGSQPNQQSGFGPQGPQSFGGLGQQYRPSTIGSSGTSGSQANQQPSFGPQGSQFNGRPSQGVSGSEFGGPRQPPSFSSQEGYKY